MTSAHAIGMRAKMAMRLLWFLAVLLAALAPAIAHAKRTPPPKVEPVVYEGVRYVVPNDNGRRAYLQAWDGKTTNMLWEVTIFRNFINPVVEEDVQWIFIKSLRIEDTKLIVVDERDRAYSVNLLTRKAKRLKQVPPEKLRTHRASSNSLAMLHSARRRQWDG
jgi:hypothetical protein